MQSGQRAHSQTMAGINILELFQLASDSAVSPARVHSSSCQSLLVPLTLQAPSIMLSRMIASPPARRITGAASPITMSVIGSGLLLGTPHVADAIAFPMASRLHSTDGTPSIRFKAMSRPS